MTSRPLSRRPTPWRPRAIHQFHGGSGVGDAVTGGLFYVRDLLREMGFRSEIYCADVAPELAGDIHGAASLPDDPDSLLLVHYSWRIAYLDWLRRLSCRQALVYHNITPEEFFDNAQFVDYARESRAQLRQLGETMPAALTQSDYSARELRRLGFAQVDVQPLLFDPARWRAAPVDEDYLRRLYADPAFKILFVGRIVANKCQDDLVRVMEPLRRLVSRPVRLIMPGGLGAGQPYQDHVLRLVQDMGLQAEVTLPGKVDAAQLRALYRGCDLFLCLSEHEGFAVPVIEAMGYDLPVVAYATTALPETVDAGGLLIDYKSPERVAATVKVLMEQPALRRRLVLAGRETLARYRRAHARDGLRLFLERRLGVDLPPMDATGDAVVARPRTWRIEGPVDSSYSLAIVNRRLAGALSGIGETVGLKSTEGPGDFEPDAAFVAGHPEVRDGLQRGAAMDPPDIAIRNLYPPRVSGMSAPTRVLGNWGWEESGLPPGWPARFNDDLHLVTAVSRFVAKVLVDNGVRVPVAVVGNGTDHLLPVAAAPLAHDLGDGSFRFLHVSSGFPRKGPDVLLEAWRQAFRKSDDVSLVLKTFPNPHNTIRQQLHALRQGDPDAADVILIDEDIADGELVSLYRACHVLVAPSRGEGFGLPIAEAIHFGLSVVATGHGGQRDFCSPDTAWLVDFAFARSDTHLGTGHSVWAQPSVEDLARALRAVRDAPPEERRRRNEAGRALLETRFTWRDVARRTVAAVDSLDARTVPTRPPTVAWVSSWNVRCGIASYARLLAGAFPPGVLQVFASRAGELLSADQPFVRRCWNQSWDDTLDDLHDAIRRGGCSHAVIQFNFGFFGIRAFGRLLDRLKADGIRCIVVLHSTQDVNKPDIRISLSEIRDSLAGCERLVVHGVPDLNRLKRIDLVDNVMLLPHGIAGPVPGDPDVVRERFGRTRGRVLATFGYLLPDKGLVPMVEAFARLRQSDPDLQLLMLNSLYPAPESLEEAERVRRAIAQHGVAEHVSLVTDYLPDEDAQAGLQVADLVVYPYQRSQESASGAVRFGLASGRPVACTPLGVFDDVASTVHMLPGIDADALAAGIRDLLDDRARLASRARAQADLLQASNWRTVSKRLWNFLQAPPVMDLLDG